MFFQQVLAGLGTGSIYALIGMAVVMGYQATRYLNFAQGEMALLSAFLAWQLMQWGFGYWAALLITIPVSFLGGMGAERFLFRPLYRSSVLAQLGVSIALLCILNSTAGFLWGYEPRAFETPFGFRPLIGVFSTHAAGMLATTLLIVLALALFFRRSRLGLSIRAAAADARTASLLGVDVGRAVMIGTGIGAAIGAVAGILIAPVVFLSPDMMLGIMLYGFGGAVLGGLGSPFGAALGGLSLGVLENLAATYVPVIGGELKQVLVLAIIFAVLIIRPEGLFGIRRQGWAT